MSRSLPHPLILGHRGAPCDAPENTLRSFRRALEQGADGVELDVQRSAEGVPVVIHDPTLDRTTSGSGTVADTPLSALRGLDAGGGERIPTLEEAAVWAAETGAWLNVEIKAVGAVAAALRVLERTGMLDSMILSSFRPAAVEQAGRLAPEALRFLLLEEWSAEARREVGRIGANGVCLEDDAATPDALREIAAAGLPVIIWTTDDPLRMRMLLGAGVAGIITNRPGLGIRDSGFGTLAPRPRTPPIPGEGGSPGIRSASH